MFQLLMLLFFSLSYNSQEVYNQLEYKEYVIEYGNEESEAIIKIINLDTNAEHLVFYNQQDFNFVEYVAVINEDCFLAIYHSYDKGEYELPHNHSFTLFKYSFQGKELDTLVLSNTPTDYYNHSGYLIIQFEENIMYINQEMQLLETLTLETEYMGSYEMFHQGEAYLDGELVEKINIDYPGYYHIEIIDDDYDYSRDITIEPIVEIHGEYLDGYYLSSVQINAYGELYLNNESYEPNQEIIEPGYYHFVLKGKNDFLYEKDFIIYPIISYFDGEISDKFIENIEFESCIRLYSNALSLALDGDFYQGDSICLVGNHMLTVYGVNQMRFDIPFSISSSFHLERISEYEVILTILGEGLLNGEVVSGTFTLDTPGEYKFELLLENQVIETVYFSIVEFEVETQNPVILRDILSYIFIAIVMVGSYFILRKK